MNYPRIALWLPYFQKPADAARFDYVLLTADLLGMVAPIRAANPNAKLLLYFSAWLRGADHLTSNGGFLPDSMLLKDATGALVDPGWGAPGSTFMGDLSRADYRDTLVGHYMSLYDQYHFDGVLIDNAEDWVPGIVTSVAGMDMVAFSAAFARGVADLFAKTRSHVGPTALLMGNGASRDYNGTTDGSTYEDLPADDGKWWPNGAGWYETVAGPRTDHPGAAAYKDWDGKGWATVLTYEYDDTGAHSFPSPPNYRKARFGLCTALMSNGYFAWGICTAGQADKGILWLDEYDCAGKGYLGSPTGSPALTSGAWRRDFEHGIALVNPTSVAITVTLGATFRKLTGKQAPTVNDGTTVTAVTIPAHDGLVLLRTTQPAPTVTVPNVVKMSGKTAVDTLKAAGLVVTVTNVPRYTIGSQSVPAGSKVPKGTAVTITQSV